MVNRSNQKWEVGQTVKVGFVSGLVVVAKCPTPGDFAPDAYALKSGKGTFYRFVPHNGLSRRSLMRWRRNNIEPAGDFTMNIVSRIATDSPTTIADPMQALWDDYRQKVAAWEAAGTPFRGESVKAMRAAEDRFIDTPTTSPLGILLKLEHIAETDNLAKDPSMTVSRLVLGLLADLRADRAGA